MAYVNEDPNWTKQPKKSTHMDDRSLMLEEKKMLRQLEEERKAAAQKAAAQMSKELNDRSLMQAEKKYMRQLEQEEKRKAAAQKAQEPEIPLPSGDTATRNPVIDYEAADREVSIFTPSPAPVQNPIFGQKFWDTVKGFVDGLIEKYANDNNIPPEVTSEMYYEDYENEDAYYGGRWLGNEYANSIDKDFVFDVSLSFNIPDTPLSGTIGYSYIYGKASDYTAGYVHVGGGFSVGLFPVGGSVSIGIVENAPTPEDYDEWFVNISEAMGIGVDYCSWPDRASATSITLSTNASAGVRLDYYFLVHSEVDGQDYYDLYKK